MAQISRDSILQLLEQRGPLVPNEVKKVLGGDTIIIGATLAELSSRKLVKITSIKRGGSPYYYLPGQENQLETIIKHLPPREQEVIEFLKREKVVQDNTLEVFQRAALRQLKDFAKEFKASTLEGEILFWRYFTIPLEEAIAILNERFSPKKENKEVETEAKREDLPENQQQLTSLEEENKTQETTSEEVPEREDTRIINTVQEVQAEINSAVEEENKEVETEAVTVKDHSEEENKVLSEDKTASEEIINEALKKEPSTMETNRSEVETKSDSQRETEQEKIIIEPALEETPFYKQILAYFDSKGIKMLSEEQLSKDKEYEFMIEIPSAVGNMTLLCRARNKKRLNESDVAPALLRAKSKNLFCLFLTPGDFTKKSKELIAKEYTGLIIKQL